MKIEVITSFDIAKQKEVSQTFEVNKHQAIKIIQDTLDNMIYQDRATFLAKYGILPE